MIAPHKVADHRLGILNFAGADPLSDFLTIEPTNLNAFVVHWLLLALGKIRGLINVHLLGDVAGARPKGCELAPSLGAITGLFAQLPFSGIERRLAGIN